MNKKNKIKLDHIYCIDQDFVYFNYLKQVGFKCEAKTVEHPGGVKCKFIYLEGANKKNDFYMEFVSFSEKMSPLNIRPGISLAIGGSLLEHYKKMQNKIKCRYIHKNYKWKENSKDYLPGWNMVEFEKNFIRDIFVWFTEYEYSPERKLRKAPHHPNGVIGLTEVVLELKLNSQKKIEKIIGSKIAKNYEFSNGIKLSIVRSRKDRVRSLVLKTKKPSSAFKLVDKQKKIIRYGEEFGIELNGPSKRTENMWNIIIV